MTESVAIRVTKEGRFVRLLGGLPGGRDALHRAVVEWPGWSRLTGFARLGNRNVSTYEAPAYPASMMPLSHAKGLAIDWGPGARERVLAVLQAQREALLCLQDGATGELFLPTARKPLPHQAQAIRALVYMEGCALLADDMGLGKTSTVLWALHLMQCLKVLVICPSSVKFNWPDEVRATLGQQPLVNVIDGIASKRADQFADLLACVDKSGNELVVAVINYDLLWRLTDNQRVFLRGFAKDGAVVCDESHFIKNPKSDRSEFVADLASEARYRIAISGTPAWNTIEDLYGQVEFVRPGTWKSQADFTMRYVVMGSRQVPLKKAGKLVRDKGGDVVTKGRAQFRGGKNLNKLNWVMNTVQIRREKEQVLGLPPKIYSYPQLELTGTDKKVYRAMKDYALYQLSELDEHVTSAFDPKARTAVETAIRCEQIAQGFVGGLPESVVANLGGKTLAQSRSIPGRPRELVFPDSEKMRWTLDTLHALHRNGKQTVVYCRFNAPLIWLAMQFEKAAHVTGSSSASDRAEVFASFGRGQLSALFIQVKIAQGFNLTTCSDVIFLGRDWAPATNLQAEDRSHRIGTKGTVQIQIPIVRGTIETMIHRKLSTKSADASAALASLTIKELAEAL